MTESSRSSPDKIDAEIIGAMPESVKIIANYAVGYNNIDVPSAHAAEWW